MPESDTSLPRPAAVKIQKILKVWLLYDNNNASPAH